MVVAGCSALFSNWTLTLIFRFHQLLGMPSGDEPRLGTVMILFAFQEGLNGWMIAKRKLARFLFHILTIEPALEFGIGVFPFDRDD